MAKMGAYCKAYPVQKLRAFRGWDENVGDGKGLGDDDFLYLQENFVVTDGIYLDENIVYDNVTAEWVDYCKNTLKFSAPAHNSAQATTPN
jgi:hypothetical protein